MNKSFFSFLIIGLFLTNPFFGQNKYWVYLTDKNNVEFDPYLYFDSKAIERRVKLEIPLDHISDYPIRDDYKKIIRQLSDSITGHTRWFNALACIINDENIEKVKELSFVKKIEPLNLQQQFCDLDSELNHGEKELLSGQLEWMEGEEFSKNNFNGKGIRICVIDAGFPNVDNAEMFSHIRDSGNIINTWDFHKNDANVYKFSSHGTTVLSCIAGIYNGKKMGLATESEFLLARTERVLTESVSEEEDWLMAVEWADKNGADIINSSLGYNVHAYFIEDMDGKTSIISRAGNLAAAKGILVINAAGNSGDNKWKYISTPADADSVLSIGGINPWTGLHTSFSSYGPTSDFRLKPNVTGFGHVMGYSNKNIIQETQGTSFSCPLISGFAACAWESDRTLSNMELFGKIENSAHLFPYFDYAHGYGIPKASFFTKNKKEVLSTFKINETTSQIQIVINDEFFSITNEISTNPYLDSNINDSFEHLIDNYSTAYTSIKKVKNSFFYFHVENNAGHLDSYKVLSVSKKDILVLNKNDYINKILRFYYKGYTLEIDL